MARTTTQVQQSLVATIQGINPTLDVQVGPLYNYVIAPVAPEISFVESQVERLLRYYSVNFEDVATADEVRDFAINFAAGVSDGMPARGSVYFFRNSAPLMGEIYTIRVGDLVGTADRNLLFKVTQQVEIVGDFAATYYNPSTNRYEVSVPVEAISPGILYNIPANRIVRLLSNIRGIDGVEQRTSMSGGTEAETTLDVVSKVRTKFLGLDTHSVGGIISTTLTLFANLVLDLKIVRPTDRLEFRRSSDNTALDLCIYGEVLKDFSEDYLAIGGETLISLQSNLTAVTISDVQIGGTSLDSTLWEFVPDTSLEYQLSTAAHPKIQLTSALSTNDLLTVVGQKNDLLDQIQAVWGPDDQALFKTDILIRSFLVLPVTVQLEARINTGDIDAVQGTIQGIITNILQGIPIPSAIYPDLIVETLKSSIPEIVSIKMLKFKRTYSALSDVEPIIPLKNQRPTYDTTYSTITVRM